MTKKKTSIASAFAKPDWDHWARMGAVSLAEATMLSFDREPDDDLCHRDFLGNFFLQNDDLVRWKSDPLTKRYDLAASQIGQEGGLTIVKHSRTGIPKDMPCVSLDQYGTWAISKGILLSKRFPNSARKPIASSGSAVSIAFPYASPFIQGLADIMWKNYSDLGPNESPNQKKVGLEIDEKFGWKNEVKNSKASRPAQGVASKLKPE